MAAKSFLTIVDEKYGVNANYQGDEFGGSTGHDGRGFPKHDMRNFMFATGIECSNPTINNGTWVKCAEVWTSLSLGK
jgi:hypothetical protein